MKSAQKFTLLTAASSFVSFLRRSMKNYERNKFNKRFHRFSSSFRSAQCDGENGVESRHPLATRMDSETSKRHEDDVERGKKEKAEEEKKEGDEGRKFFYDIFL